MTIIVFGSSTSEQRDFAERKVCARLNTHRHPISIVSPAKFYLSDQMIGQYLSLSNDTFAQVKKFLDGAEAVTGTDHDLAADAKRYLTNAATSINKALIPVHGILVSPVTLLGNKARMYFGDRNPKDVADIARYRSLTFLRNLASANRRHNPTVFIIDSEGMVVEKPINVVLEELQTLKVS